MGSGDQDSGARGYALAALLVSLAVMSIVLSVVLPVWRHQMRREKEAELIFRGEQYARALDLFQRKYPGALPPNVDVLVEQKFLRKKYKDPITNDDFQVLYQASAPPGGPPQGAAQPSRPPVTVSPQPAAGAGPARRTPGPQGGVIGVASKSKDQSIRLYKGRNRYNEWIFQFTPVTRQPGALPGGTQPGQQPGLPSPPGGAPRPGEPRPQGGSIVSVRPTTAAAAPLAPASPGREPRYP